MTAATRGTSPAKRSASPASKKGKKDVTSAEEIKTTIGPPKKAPTFDVKQIRDAIPEHCWKRNTFTSMYYLLKDFACIAILGYFSTFISAAPLWTRFLLWPAYWFMQGVIFTGVWVLAHEAGHQSFSESKLVNDVVGWFCHSSLLVPYFSWAYSHSQHHKYTNSMEHDEVFVPNTKSAFKESISESPIANAITFLIMITFGWPGYLIANFSGPAKYANKSNSHFNPFSALFPDKYRIRIVLSDIGFFGAVGLLAYCSYTYGVSNVIFYYFIPYLINNFFLVTITYLQHSDTYVPHYREGEFTWLKGALCTVDRPMHPILDYFLHNINDTHVVHHLFSQMPHYHATEATEAVKKVLGPYYLRDDTNFLKALWKTWSICKYVEDEGDVLFYKTARDFNEEKAKLNKKKN